MKKNFKTWLCSILVIGATLSIGLFAGCTADELKSNIDQVLCQHNYGVMATKVVKKATCTAEGEELWTCLDCGKEKTVVLDKLEHTVVNWVTKQKATCREEGIKEGKCSNCKTTVTESIVKLPHVEVEVEGKASTCTVAGYTEYSYCSACNDFIIPKVTIPALGHDVKVIEGYSATCTSKGLTDGKSCLDCGEVLTEQKEIPALGHKIEYLAPVAPTCEMTGLTAGYACVRCDKVYTAQTVVEKLPHVDEDGDNYCDDCYEFLSEASELTVFNSELIAGNWYRIYKKDSVSGADKIVLSSKDNRGEPVFLYLLLHDTGLTFSVDNKNYIPLEGLEYRETDGYIDVHFVVGSYANGFYVTEDMKLATIGGYTVKGLAFGVPEFVPAIEASASGASVNDGIWLRLYVEVDASHAMVDFGSFCMSFAGDELMIGDSRARDVCSLYFVSDRFVDVYLEPGMLIECDGGTYTISSVDKVEIFNNAFILVNNL